MSSLQRRDGAGSSQTGSEVETVLFEELQPGVVAVRAPALRVRERLRADSRNPSNVQLDKTFCPWCGRGLALETKVEMPQVLVCGVCGGVWILERPPHHYTERQALALLLTGG
jgi:ribosomal protein S27AE